MIRGSFLEEVAFDSGLNISPAMGSEERLGRAFQMAGTVRTKPKGGKRLGWVQEAEDRCGWWVVSSLGSLSQDGPEGRLGQSPGAPKHVTRSRLALEVMGSHGVLE